MSHPTAVEIHDHVYGFRRSGHVEECPDCRSRTEALEREREVLGEVLRAEAVEPPAGLLRPRRRLSWAPLAAAAGLLAVLGVLLFLPAGPTVPGRPTLEEELRRLAGELKSPSELRRDVALVALKAYGAQAHPVLVAAGVDPAITDLFKTPSAADGILQDRLKATRPSFSIEDLPALEALAQLNAQSPLPVAVSEEAREALAGRRVTFKVKDLQLQNTYTLFVSQFGLVTYVLDGKLQVARPRLFMDSRCPIRLGPPDPAAVGLARTLGDAASVTALRRLGFAAESALWAVLDGPQAVGAAGLLEELYTPKNFAAPLPGAEAELRNALFGRKITLVVDGDPLVQALDQVREASGINLHVHAVEAPAGLTASFQCRNLPAYAALRLLVDPFRASVHAVGNGVQIEPRKDPPSGAAEAEPFWAQPAVAGAVEKALADLDSADEARRQAAEAVLRSHAAFALGPLRASSARPRARELLVRICRELDLRLAEDPPPAYLDSLTEEGRALLDRVLAVDARDETLEGLLGRLGITVRAGLPDARKFRFRGEVTVRGLLEALTRPVDLDWRLDGTTVVLDAPGIIRAEAEGLRRR